jgi:hypothetical protein
MLPRVPKGARGVKHRITVSATLGGGDAAARHRRLDVEVRSGRDLHHGQHARRDCSPRRRTSRPSSPPMRISFSRRPSRRCRTTGRSLSSRRNTRPLTDRSWAAAGAPPAVPRGAPPYLSPKDLCGGGPLLHPGGGAGAMLTYVPIANTALQHLGEADRIVAPEEDSKPARAIGGVGANPPLCACGGALELRDPHDRDRRSSDDPKFPIALGRKAFPIPADCVTFIEIVEPCSLDEEDSYSIEAGPTGMEILCDHPGPLTIRYVRDGEDDRRSGALVAGLCRGVRLPARMANQRRARGRQRPQGSRPRRL